MEHGYGWQFIGNVESVTVLINALTNENPNVREHACSVPGKITAPEALKAIEEYGKRRGEE